MPQSLKKKILLGSASGIISKIIDAFAKLFTIPLLITYYGKADFGLITLAISLNAYLRIMDLGMNTGAVRFFSVWFANGENEKLTKASQTSFVFYGIIGFLNALILILVSIWADRIFNIKEDQLYVLRWMLYVLAISAIFYWAFYIVTQLLISFGEIEWTNYATIITSILNLLTAYIAVKFKLALPTYFVIFIVSTIIIIPFNIYKLNVFPVSKLKLFLPKWNSDVFNEIIRYSLGLFVMGLFHFSADGLRPILLSIYSKKGPVVLTDYRIMNTIVMLVSAVGSVFLQVLLPVASKSHAAADNSKIEFLVNDGTKYISLFLSFVIFILIINIKSLLLVYMGPEFLRLSGWLTIWLFLMLYMHDYAISSLVLSIGKTKFLIYSSAIGSVLSLIVTGVLIPKFEVGATIIGFSIFILIQVGFNYFYYLPFVLKINSKRVFLKCFLPFVLVGVFSSLIIWGIGQFWILEEGVRKIFFDSILFSLVFGVLTFSFIFKLSDFKLLILKYFNKGYKSGF